MNEAPPKTPLFTEFEATAAETWENRIRKDLKETPYESLLWKTEDGITVKPFYTRQDLPQNEALQPDDFPFVRTARNRDNQWENIQAIYVRNDSHQAIDKAAAVLQRGADGIHFILKEPLSFDFAYLLTQPRVIGSSVSFTFPSSPETYLQQYLDAARSLGLDLSLLRGFIQYEPSDEELAGLPSSATIAHLLDLVKETPGLYPLAICGSQHGNRGATISQEIGFVLSAAVCLITQAEVRHIAPEKVMAHLQFQVAVGTNYFFEIAKFRALRLLWSAIVTSYGLPGELASRLRIHATTSRWHQTVFDPHVNLLRATTEAMSAILGGCDSLSVAPFDSLFKTPDDFSERIARNISVILKEESYLDKAIDPAAGSYYLETLTKELAESGWNIFKALEVKGGYRKAVESGLLNLEIKKVTDARFKALSNRELILVGTNKYPNLQEKIEFEPERLMQTRRFDSHRAAYPFEIMRMASELHYRKKQRKARAVIAVIGTKITEHLHATFAKEFFECANFETHIFHFETIDQALDSLENDPAKVVVLSGSEDQYNQFDQELVARIKNHVAKPVLILAATPKHMEQEMEEKGFDKYIFQGCNLDSIISCIQQKVMQEADTLD